MRKRLLTIAFICILLCLLCAACGKEAAPKKGVSREPVKKTAPVTATPSEVPGSTDVPGPTEMPSPTEAPFPSGMPTPTETPFPSEMPTPTEAPSPTDVPGPTEMPSPTDVPGPGEEYIDISGYGFDAFDVVEYYLEIGMSSEYANGNQINYVRKWTDPIRVYVGGYPREQDFALITRLFDALNGVYGFPGIDFCDDAGDANMEVSFLDPDDYFPASFKAVGTDITDGYSTIWFEDGVIYKAEIGIRTDLTDTNKNHVILEEIVQALGLQNDSYLYPDSLYYQGFNEPQWPTDMDWLLVRFLYRPEMKPLMKEAEVWDVAETVFRN